jgi:hypothetical protein
MTTLDTMSDNTSTETLMELIKAYVPETEVPMVASFVLKLAGDLSLEQEKTHQLREALSDLVPQVAIYGGLLHDDRCLHSPNEYPDDCWRDNAHDATSAARQALQDTSEQGSQDA